MKIILVVFLLCCFLASTPSAQTRWEDSPTFGKPSEEFVESNSELILDGRFVPAIEYNGKRGYIVRKTLREVLVNDVVHYNIDTHRKVYTPQDMERSRRAVEVVNGAAREIRPQIAVSDVDRSVMFRGRRYEFRDTLTYHVKSIDKKVIIKFEHEGFGVFYDNGWHGFAVDPKPEPKKSPEVVDQCSLEATYRGLISHLQLRQNSILIKGRGYLQSFPIEEAERVKASLAKIPSLARVRWYDKGFRRTHYETLEIDGYRWMSLVIEDFVER